MEDEVNVSIKEWPDNPPASLRLLKLWAEAASDFWDKPIEDLKSKRRTLDLVWPRSVCMSLAKNGGYTSAIIGKFWNRHHSTVLHAVNLVTSLRDHNETYELQYRQFLVFAQKYIQRRDRN